MSRGTYRAARSEDDFISAAEKVGFPEMEDLQSLDANNGVQRAMRYISPDGKRQDAASKYLHPKLQDGHHPNLHVLVQAQVVRILFDKENRRAVGVEYRPNPDSQWGVPNLHPIRTVKARKLVIVSSGACGTPSVLERSGIGSPRVLSQAKTPVVADVPGVGNEYEDHQLLVYPYKSSLNPEETLDAIASGRRDPEEMIKNNDDILGWNCQDVTCKLRPSDAEVAALGPEFQKSWNADFRDNPNKPLTLMSIVSG